MILGLSADPTFAQDTTDPARTLFIAGRDLLDDGRYVDAEKKFREVLAKYPKSDQADRTDYYLITTLVKLGRVNEALTQINAFQKNYPNSKWTSDVQEKRINLTNEVPPYLESSLLRQVPVAPVAPPPAPPPAPALPNKQVAIGPFGPKVAGPFGHFGAGIGRGLGPGSGDPEISLQQEILRVLLQNNPDRGIDVATERLKADPSDPVVISNLSAIARSSSEKAFPMLVAIAKTSPSSKARLDATFWVGRGPGDKDAIVTTLLEILASATEADTEGAVASALTEVGTPRALAALSEMARDRNRSVNARRTALNAIARNENPNQLTTLDDLYKNSSDSAEMRRSVTAAIARIADPRAIAILANVARTDADISVRRTAIQALGRRKEPEAIKALEDLLKDAPPVPRAQLDAISPYQFDFNFDFDEANMRDFEEQIRRAEEEAADMVRRFYFKE